MRPLRVCIDARIPGGQSGGVEQWILGLASGLSALPDDDIQYSFLTLDGEDDWLRPHVGRNTILHARGTRLARKVRSLLSGRYLRQRLRTRLPYLPGITGRIELTDGTIERTGQDVMHFTFQHAFRTKVPSIYHPHDLQHVHLPEFFSRWERAFRDHQYGFFCRQASTVAVAWDWTRRDVASHFNLAPENVRTIHLASPVSAYADPTPADLDRARRELQLPETFALYPAQTWPHKNHLRLLDAVARLRDRESLRVPVICSGRKNDFYATIDRRLDQLGLRDQVRFVGFVDPVTLTCLYRLARMVVIPTLFEAGSFPLWEAFGLGVPAACSNVTSLPEQAGEAALIFDPIDVNGIANAIRRLWTDEALREELAERGRKQIAPFTWDRAARHFRAHYRRLGGRELSEEDREILAKEAGSRQP